MRGPLVTFDHFVLFEENGRELEKIAPALARRLYARGAPRFVFNDLNETEVRRILKMAKTAPPSMGRPRRYSGVKSGRPRDRKSTRLNSSHGYISYAVFCLKKKKT